MPHLSGRGRDSVRRLPRGLRDSELRGQFAFHDVEVIGNTAWVRTTSTGHLRVVADWAEGDVANSELFVLKTRGWSVEDASYIFTSVCSARAEVSRIEFPSASRMLDFRAPLLTVITRPSEPASGPTILSYFLRIRWTFVSVNL